MFFILNSIIQKILPVGIAGIMAGSCISAYNVSKTREEHQPGTFSRLNDDHQRIDSGVTGNQVTQANIPDMQAMDFKMWTFKGDNTWEVLPAPAHFLQHLEKLPLMLGSQFHGEEKTGTATSHVFAIEAPIQSFLLAGADGTATGPNDGDNNYLALRSHPDGDILRFARPPGTHALIAHQWFTGDLIGRDVYLELVDENPKLREDGYAWIALADYCQVQPLLTEPVKVDNLFGIIASPGPAQEVIVCRSLPFIASANPGAPAILNVAGPTQEIKIGAQAEMLYLLGMVNAGWDAGVSHWGEHAELDVERDDQVYIGKEIGRVEIHYKDGELDEIPLVMGSTAFFVQAWAHGPSHAVPSSVREPFDSRPDFKELLQNTLRLKEDNSNSRWDIHYYLPVKPRKKPVDKVLVFNNTEIRGNPYISSVTLQCNNAPGHAHPFPSWTADARDLLPTVDLEESYDFHGEAQTMADALYMCEEDLPESVHLIPFPEDLDATRIRFLGGVEGDMLTNVWTANLALINEKFPAQKGVFWESVKDIGPWYGGYSGIGTWAPVGVYWGEDLAFARCSDHYATLALRHINNKQRLTSFVDYVDHWLYFFRHDHDPGNGPENSQLDLDRYPEGAYPNWSFVITGPMGLPYGDIDPIPGVQETDGHGATVVARWMAWRMMGSPTDDWLESPRDNVWGKSRWQSTFDAAEFICWYMDFTGMDVMFSEGETTGWAGGPLGNPQSLVPPGMGQATDPEEIRRHYANSNMYHVYPTWVCAVGLRCSAEMAEARGDGDQAARWRSYADRLQQGMYRLLRVGDHREFTWKVSPHSVYPTLQESLVHAWFSIYKDGLDSKQWDPLLTPVTFNTLKHQLDQPYGHAPVLSMGYGQGWLAKSALMFDAMDDAGPLIWNIAKYSYDKNMNFVDEEQGIDWRRWIYIIPEGTNILPDGRWHRIGDLSNGANQGPAMHALEVCAGVDDTNPNELKIMPRVPDPLTGIEVRNHPVMMPSSNGLAITRIDYRYDRDGTFKLKAEAPLQNLAVRMGPFDRVTATKLSGTIVIPQGSTKRVEMSGSWNNDTAWWLWIENIHDMEEVSFK